MINVDHCFICVYVVYYIKLFNFCYIKGIHTNWIQNIRKEKETKRQKKTIWQTEKQENESIPVVILTVL